MQLKKIRRSCMNEWEYSYGTQIIKICRSHNSMAAYALPNNKSGDEIFRDRTSDLYYFIRQFREHLKRIASRIEGEKLGEMNHLKENNF